jgi:hypothetical protein
VVAFLFSSIIGILGVAGVIWYGKNRRAPGAPLTWGQANAAAAFVFFFMFWWYGIIPHQWLMWADNELNWRPDRTLWGVGNIFRPQEEGGWLPMTLNWMHVRDLVAVAIYAVGLGGQIWLWAWWNDRKKKAEAAAAVVPTSSYGRPLVRKG